MSVSLNRGYLQVGRFRGAPVRLHWTILVGAAVMTRLHFVPGSWIGVFLILLAHEIGHALLADHFGLLVIGIDVNGFGGSCTVAGTPTRRQHAVIAWGGVLAQAALLVATLAVLAVSGWPAEGFFADLADAFTWSNAGLIALNLLPIPPLDGAEAWKILR